MQLQYDISAIGTDQVKRALRSIEREASAANRRMLRDANRESARTQRPRAALASREQSAAAKLELRAAREREKLDLKATREREAAERRISRERQRGAEKAAQAETKAVRQRELAARRDVERQRLARVATARSIAGGAARTIGGVARAGAAIGGLLGGVGVYSAIDDQIEVQSRASRLANQAGNPALKGQLAKEARSVTGFSGSEALEGIEQFTSITGDLDAARASLADFGKLALATGTDLGELMAAAGNAFVPLKDQISDPTERLAKLKDVMRSVAGMGNIGAVEIKDMASQLAGLAAQSGKFEGGADKVISTAVAMAQAARQRGGAASAAEAVTSVERFGDDLITNSGRFEKMGVSVFADKGRTKLRRQEDIMVDVLKKTGGDQTKIKEGFGIYSARAVSGFSSLFTDAERKKPGSGEAAVRAEFERYKRATMSESQVNTNVASRMQDPDVLIKENLKRFNEAIGTQLVPELTKLIPKLSELTPQIGKAAKGFADLVSWVTENPWKGIGALLLASLGKELAVAGIGSAVSGALTKAIGAASSGGLGRTAGYTGAAVAAVALAKSQADAFAQENKGVSLTDTMLGGVKSVFSGDGFRGFFDVADAQANEQARRRREEEDRRSLQEVSVAPEAKTPPGATPPASATPDDKSQAAAKLEGAASKLASAADKLGAAGGARSGSPIVAR